MAELARSQRLPALPNDIDPSEFPQTDDVWQADFFHTPTLLDEVAVMAPADLHLLERNGWPIHTPEAYPVALRFEPGREPQSPTSEDLDYIESCLCILPDFVTSDQAAKTYEVAPHGKRLKLRLSWTNRRR